MTMTMTMMMVMVMVMMVMMMMVNEWVDGWMKIVRFYLLILFYLSAKLRICADGGANRLHDTIGDKEKYILI